MLHKRILRCKQKALGFVSFGTKEELIVKLSINYLQYRSCKFKTTRKLTKTHFPLPFRLVDRFLKTVILFTISATTY